MKYTNPLYCLIFTGLLIAGVVIGTFTGLVAVAIVFMIGLVLYKKQCGTKSGKTLLSLLCAFSYYIIVRTKKASLILEV